MNPKNAAQAQDRIDALKAILVNEVRDDARYDRLASLVNKIAHAQGVWHVLARTERASDNGLGDMEMLEMLSDLLVTGADDSWSGRGNDANRARFDGIREAVGRANSRIFNRFA